MDRQTFLALTSSSQWVLFLAIGLIIFSWVEKKKFIQQSGQLTFFLLGIFALWVILAKQIVVPDMLPGAPVPAEAKAITYFMGLMVTGVIGLLAFTMSLFKPAWTRFANIVLVTSGLPLFFMVYELQRIP
jgi:hypothetical protein